MTGQREEILEQLARLSELAPEFRFGQMIANLSYLANGPTNEVIWDMQDDQLLEALREMILNFKKRTTGVV